VHEALLARPLGAQRVEDRQRALDVLRRAAGHQAVADLPAPDAAGHATVDVVHGRLAEQLGVQLVVGEPGVTPVDHHVASIEQLTELTDRVPGRVAGRHHDPDDPRRGQ